MASRASLYLSVVRRTIENAHVELQNAHMKILKSSDKMHSVCIGMPGVGKDRQEKKGEVLSCWGWTSGKVALLSKKRNVGSLSA